MTYDPDDAPVESVHDGRALRKSSAPLSLEPVAPDQPTLADTWNTPEGLERRRHIVRQCDRYSAPLQVGTLGTTHEALPDLVRRHADEHHMKQLQQMEESQQQEQQRLEKEAQARRVDASSIIIAAGVLGAVGLGRNNASSIPFFRAPERIGSGKAKCPPGDQERKRLKRQAQAERCRQEQERRKAEGGV